MGLENWKKVCSLLPVAGPVVLFAPVQANHHRLSCMLPDSDDQVENRSSPVPEDLVCPGCGLRMPHSPKASYDGYYNTSPECWEVYTEVLAVEFSNAILFGQVHQLSVDSYAVQHAGGPHPDKSVVVHLMGLYLVLDRKLHPMRVPRHLQVLASRVKNWPHYPKPAAQTMLTVLDVALSATPTDHIAAVRKWAEELWHAWSDTHGEIAGLAAHYLTIDKD